MDPPPVAAGTSREAVGEVLEAARAVITEEQAGVSLPPGFEGPSAEGTAADYDERLQRACTRARRMQQAGISLAADYFLDLVDDEEDVCDMFNAVLETV